MEHKDLPLTCEPQVHVKNGELELEYYNILNNDGNCVAQVMWDAEFIVEACNNYEKLQQINKELIEGLDRARDYVSYMAESRGTIVNLKGKLDYLNTVLERAKEITP